MTEYTPTTEGVRDCYTYAMHTPAVSRHQVQFDRWLAGVKADALREAAEAFAMGEGLEAFAVANVTDDVSAVRATSKWLDARADKIERVEQV